GGDVVGGAHGLPRGTENQRWVVEAVGVGCLQGQWAANPPNAMPASRICEKLLYFPRSRRFPNREFVAITVPHETKVVGQGNHSRPLFSRLGNQSAGPRQIGIQRRA